MRRVAAIPSLFGRGDPTREATCPAMMMNNELNVLNRAFTFFRRVNAIMMIADEDEDDEESGRE